MFEFPPIPTVPAEQRNTGPGTVRYEDIAQDGRLMLLALPPLYGTAIFRDLIMKSEVSHQLTMQGVIPILTRLVLTGTDEIAAVSTRLEGEGGFALAHTKSEGGSVSRILVNLWADAMGTRGRTYGAQPPGAGERVKLGTVFAEHVMTRLFAPPEQRKVLSLQIDGQTVVPPLEYDWRTTQALLTMSEGAIPLAPFADLRTAPADTITFSLCHTDSNQHVNSLVYPRLFEERAAGRLAAAGVKTAKLARFIECAYRKPCFAGDTVELRIQLFELTGALREQHPNWSHGALGAFVPPGSPIEKAHCTALLAFG